MDPWSAAKSISALALGSDTNLAKVLAAKKALTLLSNHSDIFVKLCLAACDGDNHVVKDLLSSDSSVLNKMDKSGLTPLIYAVCFNQLDIVELLVNFNVDCNQHDEIFQWTPLMWATYLNFKNIVTILLEGGADPLLKSPKSSKNAVDLALPGSEMYEYFLDHNIIKAAEPIVNEPISSPSLRKSSPLLEDPELEARIKLQVAGVGNLTLNDNSEDDIYKSAAFGDSPSFFSDDTLYNITDQQFDFEKVLPKQFLKFHDRNLTLLLDYVFSLYDKYQHKTTLPAAVIYQCLRYADNKLESKELCGTVLDLFLTRIRSATNTKSGVPSVSDAKGDIVMLSYWLSTVNFLYYYLYRDTACDFFKKYPKFLQELVNTMQTLIAQLSFSINNRLSDLIDVCILDYTSLPDSKNVMFQKEWHFFKKKYLNTKTTYDEILDMLYPPPPKQQMKPSPLKIAQTLGALLYVLNLHSVNDLIKQQTLSGVLYWIGASILNRILANKTYQSRTRAMQIRLNISVIEDWLRSNDFKPDVIDENLLKDKTFPDKLSVMGKLTNVARYNGDINDPTDLTFYYNSLYKIGKHHLMPSIEMLQWLQVMTSLKTEDSLDHTLSSFIMINPVQIYKVTKGYRYEIGEARFPKEISQQLKSLVESKKYDVPKNVFYASSDKLEHFFLNPDVIFPVALVNIQQLIKRYAGSASGQRDVYARQYLPFLPIEVLDSIDDLNDQYLDGYDDYNEEEKSDSEDEENGNGSNMNQAVDENANDSYRGAELFKEVQMPSGLAHKAWGEIEENPW